MSVEWYKSLRETRMHSQRSDFGVRRKLSDNVMSVEIVRQKWGFVCRLKCIVRVLQKRQNRIYVWNYVSWNFRSIPDESEAWKSGDRCKVVTSPRLSWFGIISSEVSSPNTAIFRGDTVRLYSCIHSVSPVNDISSRGCSSRFGGNLLFA